MYRLIGKRLESVEQVPKKSASNSFGRANSYYYGSSAQDWFLLGLCTT
jgi:hypothetical protein